MSVSIQVPALPFKVKAKYGWSGQTKGDLGFLEGDVMEVTRITGDWFYGRLLRNKKCSGYFPNNFVNILEERLNRIQEAKKKEAMFQPPPPSPESSKKIGIPPIPARSIGEGSSRSSRSSKSSDSSIKAMARRQQQQEVANVKHLRSRGYHAYSSPTLPTVSPSRHEALYAKMNRFPESASRRYEEEPSFLPELPPIPISPRSDTYRHSKLPPTLKSKSAADLNAIETSKDPFGYFQEHKDFYDGYHPSSSSSFTNGTTSMDLFSDAQYLENSALSSENSYAVMSDFSATSAGSFARHKFAQSFEDSLERSQTSAGNDSLNDSSNGKMGGVLRRMVKKGSGSPAADVSGSPISGEYPKLPDLKSLAAGTTRSDARDWLTVKTHLNRARSLTKHEKHPRYMRALDMNRDLVLHPQDAVYNGLNTNEVKAHGQPGIVDIELAGLNLEYIDNMTRRRCRKDGSMRLDNWAQTTFSARYATTVEKLRGIYVFCTEMFGLVDDNGFTDFSRQPSHLDRILYQKHCTPYQLTCLFKKLCNSLGITCEVVIGFLKTPNAKTYEFKYNHCWLRVLANKEWRFIDVILGNISNPVHEFINNKKIKRAENQYFLAEPLEFIYTHVPAREAEQHIVPSIDQLSALYLPLVFPSFFKNGLKLYKFSTALAYLEDSEIYECSLEIPSDVEVFASVVVPTENPKLANAFKKMDLALTQVKRHRVDSSRRIAVVKAILPPDTKEGALYIHSGLRGSQTTLANVHPLSMMVPLQHEGEEMKYEFVVRRPSENVQKVEMYVLEPQNKYLFVNNEYGFEIIQQPFDGILYNPSGINKNYKQPLALKSPSGKIYDLKKNDPHVAFGTWKFNTVLKETGVWTGLVLADSGMGWCSFAEWLCI
ncbi:cytokinesis protein 3 [Zygosaccharomyces mellis]|uniref:Cytokinesis protein 3 n=1 Tax=Zygosaccharomyces mellis TaxID=42258 RepID=A0A4C2E635_9SACH|nr:cytokinesis protein 3 [Zygosaccharomyces mellis]